MLRITSRSVNVLAYVFGALMFLPVVSLNFFAGGGWLDVNEYLFVPFILGSIACFSYCFMTLKSKAFSKVILNITMVIAELLGIPNLTWPIGSQWWESISLGFGLLASVFLSFNVFIFALTQANITLNNQRQKQPDR